MKSNNKHLPNLEWVHRACSLDATRGQTLSAVHATETHLAATDGHRLHIAPNAQGCLPRTDPDALALQPGNWMVGKLRGDVAGLSPDIHYPNYEAVIPKADYAQVVMDAPCLRAICEAGSHLHKRLHKRETGDGLIALPTNDGGETAYFSPFFLAEALDGMLQGKGDIYLCIPDAHAPMSLRQPATDRLAVVMPVRVSVSDAEGEAWRFLRVGSTIAACTRAQIEEVS